MTKEGEEDGDDEAGGVGWAIVIGTGGRPIRCPLPPDLSDRQWTWISERLPAKAKLSRIGDRAEAPSRSDDEPRLDALRTLTQQVCEKKIELIELERATLVLASKLQQLNYQIEEMENTQGHLLARFRTSGRLSRRIRSKGGSMGNMNMNRTLCAIRAR